MGKAFCVGIVWAGVSVTERLPLAGQKLFQWVTAKVTKDFTYLFIQYGTSGESRVLEKYALFVKWGNSKVCCHLESSLFLDS